MGRSLPVVQMTTFTDYLQSAGGDRFRLVRNQVEQYGEPYAVARDYYRPMLVALKQDLQFGTGCAAVQRAANQAHPKAASNFAAVQKGLEKFVGTLGSVQMVSPGRWEWEQPNVRVRVNPDFALVRENGSSQIIKVYFKKTPLRKFAAAAGIRLMEYAAPSLATEGAPAVLDARRGRLWTRTSATVEGIDVFLESEALAYGSLWQRLSA